MRMKIAMKQEQQKNASTGNRVGVLLISILALAYSGTIAFLFLSKWNNAISLREEKEIDYQCPLNAGIKAQGGSIDVWKDDYVVVWLHWMRLAWICYGILSVIAIIAMVGAFLVFLKPIGGCLLCPAQIFAIVVTVGLTIVRFNENGVKCTEEAGKLQVLRVSEAVGEDG